MARLVRIAIVIAMLAPCALRAEGPSLRMFGSGGNEAHLEAPNGDSPLNPDNFLDLPQFGNSADITAFFELRPDDNRWKFHAKLRATNDNTPGHHTRGQLGELYGQFNVRPWLDITIGRVIEKWGTGYAWNPTGFVNPKKNPGDPNDRRSAYRGNDMVRADFFVHDVSVSALVLPRVSFAGDGKTDYALRAYKLVGGTDVSLHYKWGNDFHGPMRNNIGVSLAHVVGDALEL